jgi:isopenicillin-N N-acyltransferase like protein
MALLELRRVELSGRPREMGRAQGELLRAEIGQFVAGRFGALADYCAQRGHSDTSGFVELGRRCMSQAQSWDPLGFEEHLGIAEGSGVDPGLLYSIANLTDVRDLLLLSGADGDEGCSAILLPPERSATGELIAAQTWDLNPSDLAQIVAVHRRPIGAAETWSITLVGCLTLIGMNAHGLALGTTNIKTRGSRIGVGYLSLMHRAIRCSDRAEAGRVIAEAIRAAAHTYWIADARGALELECTPDLVVECPLGAEPITRTNHCLAEPARAVQGEAPTSSSLARLKRLGQLLAAEERHDLDSLRAIFSDRSDGIDSINRYPEDGQLTATNAVIIMQPASRRLLACRGSADRGRFVELGFVTPA